MRKSFAFRQIPDDLFGVIYRPYARVTLYGKNQKVRRVAMIVDTGADYTLLPRREAGLLGIDIYQDCLIQEMHGIGGEETVYLYRDFEIEIAQSKIKAPVGFLGKNDCSPLFGRHLCLEVFKVYFEDRMVAFEK